MVKEEAGGSGRAPGGQERDRGMKEGDHGFNVISTHKHSPLDTRDPLALDDAQASLESSLLQFKIVKKLLLWLLLERLTSICQ